MKTYKTGQIAERLSLAVITKNEEHNIGACLKSWGRLGPAVVVDDYSSDATQQIAEKLGATVLNRQLDNFSSQKQYAVTQTTTDWILFIDADEKISDKLRNEILALDLSDPTQAFGVYRENYFLGKRVRFSGWNPDVVIRIFNKKVCRFNGELVHESVTGYRRLNILNGSLVHNSYTDPKDVRKKIEKYSDLGAQNLARKSKKRPSECRIIASTVWSFLRTIILKKGFLDGLTGFQIACMNANTTFKKYKKYQRNSSTLER